MRQKQSQNREPITGPWAPEIPLPGQDRERRAGIGRCGWFGLVSHHLIDGDCPDCHQGTPQLERTQAARMGGGDGEEC